MHVHFGQSFMTGSGLSWRPRSHTYDLNFATGQYQGVQLADLVTVRASTGMAESTTGWASFAANVPRITDKGLRVEPARTNSVRNNTMVGAVAGTPGTVPTNWQALGTTFTSQGLTFSVVSTFTESGIDFIRVRINGTSSGASSFSFWADSNIAAAQNQVWTGSVFLRLAAGSTANFSQVGIRIRSVTSGFTQTGVIAADFRASLDGTIKRQTATLTIPADGANVTSLLQVGPQFSWSAAALDMTIDIGLPQSELGSSAMAPIRTTTAATARAADAITVPVSDGTYTATYTFDDNSTQVVNGITAAGGAGYTIPTNLNRTVIKRLVLAP